MFKHNFDRLGKSPDGGADIRIIDRIRGHLYRLLKTLDASKHRHRGGRWGLTASVGLGRGNGGNLFGRIIIVSYHFLLDTATFLGIGLVSTAGICKRRYPDVASYPW